jgi:hypothetical protein
MRGDGSDTHLCSGTVETATLIANVRACGRRGVKMKRQEENRENQEKADRAPS